MQFPIGGTLYLVAGTIAGASLLASILVHETAHAVLAQRYGVEVSSITLWFLGGVAHLEDEAPNAKAEAQIAGAGPASSLAISSSFSVFSSSRCVSALSIFITN